MAACILIALVSLFQTGLAFNQSQSAMETHSVVPDVIDVVPANTITVRKQ